MKNSKNNKSERRLKVSYRVQPRFYAGSVIVPEIRLTGKWLQEIGFEEGKRIKVMIRKNGLSIIPDED